MLPLAAPRLNKVTYWIALVWQIVSVIILMPLIHYFIRSLKCFIRHLQSLRFNGQWWGICYWYNFAAVVNLFFISARSCKCFMFLFSLTAQHVVNKENNIEQAMEFLKQCDLIKIEDILPFFSDFVTIDHFKEAICSALQVQFFKGFFNNILFVQYKIRI